MIAGRRAHLVMLHPRGVWEFNQQPSRTCGPDPDAQCPSRTAVLPTCGAFYRMSLLAVLT
jgi:hypothetical protein